MDGYSVAGERRPAYIVQHVFGAGTLIFLWGIPPLLYSVHEIKEVLTSSLAPGVSVSLQPCQLEHPIYVPSDWSRGGHMTQGLGGDHGGRLPLSLRSWGQAGVSWGLAITRGVPARDWIPHVGHLSKETEGTEI